MEWKDLYPRESRPSRDDFSRYVESSLFDELCNAVEESHGVKPQMDFSVCSWEPGWNIKYRKSSKALCTIYPRQSYFICMVSARVRDGDLLKEKYQEFCAYTQKVYDETDSHNGSRWLSLEVTSREILRDVLSLIEIRTLS